MNPPAECRIRLDRWWWPGTRRRRNAAPTAVYCGRRRIVPLNVRAATCAPPRPRLKRIECGVDAVGRTSAKPFSIEPTTLDNVNTPETDRASDRSIAPL